MSISLLRARSCLEGSLVFLTYQLDTLNSAFRLLAACYLAIRGSAKSDRLRVRA